MVEKKECSIWSLDSPRGGGLTMGLSPLPPAALLPLPPEVGVTDLEMGVVGFSPPASIFLVDGVLAFDEVPLRGLGKTDRTVREAGGQEEEEEEGGSTTDSNLLRLTFSISDKNNNKGIIVMIRQTALDEFVSCRNNNIIIVV